MAADSEGNVTSLLKGTEPEKAKPAKAAAAKKGTAKKATPAKAAAKKDGGVVRSASAISKEGTQKDAWSGEDLPVTAFPTSRTKDGKQVRGEMSILDKDPAKDQKGPVARKNAEAVRKSNAKIREDRKAAADKAKADKAAAKAAAPKPAEAPAGT